MGQVGSEPPYYWLQLSSISIIGSACLLIAFILFYMIYRIKELPFRSAYFAVGFFMALLFLVQISQLFGFWNPDPTIEIILEALAAVAGIVAASVLFILVPQIMAVSKGRREAEQHSLRLERACEELGVIVEKGGEQVRSCLRAIATPTQALLQKEQSAEDQKQLELIQKTTDSLLQTLDFYLEENRSGNR